MPRFNEFEGPNGAGNFDEETFAHIGLLAHKYECDLIEKWARAKLDQKLLGLGKSNKPSQPNLFDLWASNPFGSVRGQFPQSPENLSIKVLKYLIGTSIKCNWALVRETAEQLLLETIDNTSPGVLTSATQLSEVLKIASFLGSNELKAKAYYAFLCSAGWALSPKEHGRRSTENSDPKFVLGSTANHVWWDSLDALTDAEKLCLYRGFHGLSALRSQLRVMPEVNTRCRCWNTLEGQWKTSAERDGLPDDPKQFLEEVKRGINGGRIGAHSGECGKSELLREVDKFLEGFDACLMNFFPA